MENPSYLTSVSCVEPVSVLPEWYHWYCRGSSSVDTAVQVRRNPPPRATTCDRGCFVTRTTGRFTSVEGRGPKSKVIYASTTVLKIQYFNLYYQELMNHYVAHFGATKFDKGWGQLMHGSLMFLRGTSRHLLSCKSSSLK